MDYGLAANAAHATPKASRQHGRIPPRPGEPVNDPAQTCSIKVRAVPADPFNVTRSLYRALAARVVAALIAAVVLGGLATGAAASRPDPSRITLHFSCEDPAAPESGLRRCADF